MDLSRKSAQYGSQPPRGRPEKTDTKSVFRREDFVVFCRPKSDIFFQISFSAKTDTKMADSSRRIFFCQKKTEKTDTIAIGLSVWGH